MAEPIGDLGDVLGGAPEAPRPITTSTSAPGALDGLPFRHTPSQDEAMQNEHGGAVDPSMLTKAPEAPVGQFAGAAGAGVTPLQYTGDAPIRPVFSADSLMAIAARQSFSGLGDESHRSGMPSYPVVPPPRMFAGDGPHSPTADPAGSDAPRRSPILWTGPPAPDIPPETIPVALPLGGGAAAGSGFADAGAGGDGTPLAHTLSPSAPNAAADAAGFSPAGAEGAPISSAAAASAEAAGGSSSSGRPIRSNRGHRRARTEDVAGWAGGGGVAPVGSEARAPPPPQTTTPTTAPCWAAAGAWAAS